MGTRTLPDIASIAETSSGVRKRIAYVADVIRRTGARDVLDVGCGTGEQLTMPLAALLPNVSFVGTDADCASINHARAGVGRSRPNLSFILPGELAAEKRFDILVLSEVLEHVDTPEAFLIDWMARLRTGGAVVVTVPNGYGPFEIAAMVHGLLQVSGLYAIIGRLRTRRRGAGKAGGDTCAASPHVWFFSWTGIHRLLHSCGLRVIDRRSRTLLCGFGLDGIVRLGSLEDWNASVVDRLSPRLASDWMFVLERDGSPPPSVSTRRAGMITRLRRRLHRWMADHPLA